MIYLPQLSVIPSHISTFQAQMAFSNSRQHFINKEEKQGPGRIGNRRKDRQVDVLQNDIGEEGGFL